MKNVCNPSLLLTLSPLVLALSLAACEKRTETPAKSTAQTDAHDHTDGDGHAHGKPVNGEPADKDDGHDHGPTTQLGEQSGGGFTIRASNDGVIKPGGDVPIDVWVSGGTTKVSAVRFWIGTQDAKGSVKARAEMEKDHWHTHAEAPKPLPAGSKLWVEVETAAGQKHVVGFDFKP